MQLQRWTTSIAAAMALTLGVSTVAQAQPGGPRHDRPPQYGPGHGRPGPPPGHGAHRPHHPPPPPAHQGHRPHGQWQHKAPPPHHYRGSGPDHRWMQGSRLPPQYRGQQYVVNNWRHHGLRQPPRGYHWVQYGSDYMLVAIATGVISQLIIHGMR